MELKVYDKNFIDFVWENMITPDKWFKLEIYNFSAGVLVWKLEIFCQHFYVFISSWFTVNLLLVVFFSGFVDYHYKVYID
jgi:hypothetical protein